MNPTKKLAFEFFLCELMKWDIEIRELSDFNTDNDLSLLKSLKLLFFTVAVDANNDKSLLEEIFNNFHAMPLGHVELDIYNQYQNLKYFTLDRYSLKLKSMDFKSVLSTINEYTPELTGHQKEKIRNAVTILKNKRKSLILEKAFNLVELSHTWNSWISTFNSSYSKISFIKPELIKNDFQNFEIQPF